MEPYTRLPEKYPGAILCDNDPESWYRTLCRLIENTADREEGRLRVSQAACAELSLPEVAEAFARTAEETLLSRASAGGIGAGFWLRRLKGIARWALELYRRYGISVFGRIFQKMRNVFSGGQEHQ